jgi:hypothetical protein
MQRGSTKPQWPGQGRPESLENSTTSTHELIFLEVSSVVSYYDVSAVLQHVVSSCRVLSILRRGAVAVAQVFATAVRNVFFSAYRLCPSLSDHLR